MPSNIEIKARTVIKNAETVARTLSKTGNMHEHLHQVDTFFNVPNGRMKLRTETGRSGGILITYFRSDASGPKHSKYTLCPVVDEDKLLEALGGALGVKGIVEKERKVYLVEWEKQPDLTARIHLDHVKNLGEYLEFEVVLLDDTEEQMKQGQLFANELLDKFNIKQEDLVDGAYVDNL